MRLHAPSRRELLLASGTLFAWAHMPKLAFAEGRDPRFLAVILRGALDGLATVAPVGDPDWASLRGEDALTLGGKTPALKLDEFFALNPAMPNLHRMFQAGEAIVVHACATPYRERSHFDGQDLLGKRLAEAGAKRYRLAQSRPFGSPSRRPRRSERRPRLCCRSGDAAYRPRPGAGSVVVAATGHAGERGHSGAPARSLSSVRYETRERARGQFEAHRHRAVGRYGDGAKARWPRAGASARLFFRRRRQCRKIPGAARRAARRRAGA